ncbi:MAG: leucine-rich repeat protein [Bacteroidaceae bacterium]|nr:leucine-rich repeat protein [Bacteroidaceae bacterium]
MKKSFLFYSLLSVICSLTLTVNADNVIVEGIEYSLSESGATVVRGTYSGNLVIPEYIEVDGAFYDVVAVADHCFQDNHDLESVKFEGKSVEFLGAATFERCENMHTLEMPEQSTALGEWSFAGCAKLQTIAIPEGISDIGNSMFKNCSELYEITLPSTLTRLRTDVFKGANALQTIFLNASEPPRVDNSPLPSGVTVVVPDAVKANYPSTWCGAVVMSQSDFEHPTSYTELKVYIELISESGVFYEAGTTPGTYPADKVQTFETALINAMMMLEADHSEEEYAQALEELKELREDLDASFNPITDGYYYIVSAYPEFLVKQSVEKAMSVTDGKLTWGTFDENDPTQLFRITPMPSGNFTIQSYATERYIRSSATAQASQQVLLSAEPTVEQIITPIGSLQWLITNSFCDIAYHPASHSSGSGKKGNIVTYNDNDLNGISTWYLRYVDESKLDELAAIKAQLALNNEIAALIDEAYELRDKTVTYIKTANLVTKANDEDPTQGQIISNAKDSGEGTYAALVDGDLSGDKYFHSSYHEDPHAYNYLQVDLLENSVSGFQALLALRSGTYGSADAPEVVAIYATNDTTGTAAGTAVLDSITTINLAWSSTLRSQYTPIIDLGKQYRYLRFTVLKTHENRSGGFEHPFFCLGELQVYGMSLDTEHSQYYYLDGMRAVVDQMMATTQTSEGILAEGNTTQEDIDRLRADIQAVKDLYIDTLALNQAILYAEQLLANTEVGDELGQTTQEAIDVLQAVHDQVKGTAIAEPLVKADVDAATLLMTQANEVFLQTIKSIEPYTWYYIMSTDAFRDGAPGEDDATCVDNVIYASGTDNGNALKWGLNEEGSLAYLFNPYAMWRFIPVEENSGTLELSNSRTYYVQCLGNGFYMGASNGPEATVKVSYTPVPYQLGFLGGGQFELIPADASMVNGQSSMFNGLPLHAKGDGNTIVTYDGGGYNSASSWTFSTVEDKADMIVYPSVLYNYTDIMCVPFSHSSVAELNEDVHTYAVKSMTYDAETDETTIELYDKTDFAAGEPCIIWIGDPEGEHEAYDLIIPFPTEVTDTPISGNGIAGCLHGTGFPAQTAYSTGHEYVVANDGVGIGAQTGVIDPQTYRGAVEGVETAHTLVLAGLRQPLSNPADVNGDGKTNTADVVAVYTFIEKGATSGFKREACDVNADGNVNTADVVAIYTAIIGGEGTKSRAFRTQIARLLK